MSLQCHGVRDADHAYVDYGMLLLDVSGYDAETLQVGHLLMSAMGMFFRF